MYLQRYDIDIELEDFKPAEWSFYMPVSYTEGDLIYDHEHDAEKTFIALTAEQGWEYEGKYSFTVWQDGWISGKRACAESYEEAWDKLCEYGSQEQEIIMWRCTECGAEIDERDMDGKDVREDYGDVYVWVCPACGEIDYDGRELFERID